LQNSPVCRTRISDESYRQNIPDSLSIEYINSSCHLTNENFDVRRDVHIEDDKSSSFSSAASSVPSLDCNNFFEPSFHERLASCFIDNNLTHVQGNTILSLLRTHPCFSTLPKDVRTIINTPRNHVVLTKVELGEYIHFDVEAAIIGSLLNSSSISNITELELDFNTDECTIHKSSNIHIWPIQCRISNIKIQNQ